MLPTPETIPGPVGLHLWIAGVDTDILPAGDTARLALLDALERDRAGSISHEETATRFIAARALLRVLIGGYLAIPSSEIKLDYSADGKPFLRGEMLRFSVSHTTNRIAIALTLSEPVGCDIEIPRHDRDIRRLAQRVCSPLEESYLATLADDEARDVFYSWWTAKEAVLKALGVGLAFPPAAIEVIGCPAMPCRLLLPPPEPFIDEWHVSAFRDNHGSFGSVAAPRPMRIVIHTI